METAKAILGHSGIGSVEAMAPNDRVTVTVEGQDDLVFEKVGPARLSVGHRTDRQGGNVRVPEVVFRIEGGAWIPIECVRESAVSRHDATGVDVGTFLRQWDRRLRQRGFLDAARTDTETA
jgi:hypothetical protein